MKKLLLALTIAFALTNNATAAGGGPDAYGYTWRDSNDPNGPVYNWIDIENIPGASDIKLLSDDNFRGPQPIGFNFHYYWYDVNTFYAGSNGYISFGPAQLSHPFPTMPAASLPNDIIAPMMSDLLFGGAGSNAKCWYYCTPDHDSLIVSWIDVPFFDVNSPGYTGSNTFQLILSNVDSSITFQYKVQQGTYNAITSQFMAIGIENNSGNIGLQCWYDTYPQPNYAIKFYHPVNSTYQVTDAATVFNDNDDTGGLFISKGGAPFTMSTMIKNTGNQNSPAFNVFTRVINTGNQIQVQDNLTAPAFVPAQQQLLTSANQFNPTNAGRFRFVTDTQLAGDVTPTNNSKVQELVVLDTTVSQIRLSYDDNSNEGVGLSWNGGEGGAAIYFVPPFYPCKLTTTHFYIVDNPTLADFSANIYDDNGVGGLAGTMLDSQYVFSSVINVGTWNDVPTTAPITINSGGVYVAWKMQGDGILLGQDQTAPFSNRTFEILSNTLSIYRYRDIEDVMINATIEKTGVGITEDPTNATVSVWPQPATDMVYLKVETKAGGNNLPMAVYNLNGQKVLSDTMALKPNVANVKALDVSTLANGLYIVQVGNSIRKKILVAR
jgi:hypothetical protein